MAAAPQKVTAQGTTSSTDDSVMADVTPSASAMSSLPIRGSSTPAAAAHTSTATSETEDSSDDASSSSSGSSSSEDEDDDEDDEDENQEEEEIQSVPIIPSRPAQKPTMRAPASSASGTSDNPTDLRSRLAAFLPQLAESNQRLQALKEKGQLKTFEDVEEGKDYIEMDLGLGVLEEKKKNNGQQDDDDDESESESEDEKEVGVEGRGEGGEGQGQAQDGGKKEVDVLGKMMGFKNGRPKVGISEVEE